MTLVLESDEEYLLIAKTPGSTLNNSDYSGKGPIDGSNKSVKIISIW